jgi:hypothetical protein
MIAMIGRRLQLYHLPSKKTLSRMAHNPFSGAKWYRSASQIFEHPSWSQPSDSTHSFDSGVRKNYTDRCPGKQRRATPGSDPLRDTRTRLRRIFRPGKPTSFPTSCLSEYPELPLMPRQPRGYGGRAPNFIRLFQERKIPFHAEPRHGDKVQTEISEIDQISDTKIRSAMTLIKQTMQSSSRFKEDVDAALKSDDLDESLDRKLHTKRKKGT